MSQRPDTDTIPRQSRTPVTVKGSRDGLTFILHEQFSLEEIIDDLRKKLTGEQATLFAGPAIRVTLSVGERNLTESDKAALYDVMGLRENLVVQEIKQQPASAADDSLEPDGDKGLYPPKVFYGTVRSGMKIEGVGDVVIVGDVNPGGQVIAGGNVIVMGALRGIAHAGCFGETTCVIAAVHFHPTQLRIAAVISRSPDGEEPSGNRSAQMEFAYLRDGQMAVEKLAHLPQLRG